jgi:hypothetical protein
MISDLSFLKINQSPKSENGNIMIEVGGRILAIEANLLKKYRF